MNIDIKEIRPYINVIGMLGIAFFLLAFTVDVHVSGEAGVSLDLPERLGDWLGDEMRFCQTRDCQSEFFVSAIEGRETCPRCGGRLDTISYIEAVILPEDTGMLKTQYKHPNGHALFVSIVLSGRARDSIHRPQLCLTGQGFRIVRSSVIRVPIEGRGDLGVMVLDLVRPARLPDGQTVDVPSYYAYWFVGKNRETPYHTTRMIWMGLDRVLHNIAHRWAYIAVAGFRDSHDDAYIKEIGEFIQLLYPSMLLDNTSPRQACAPGTHPPEARTRSS